MAVLQKIGETKTFVEECWIELQKVTWPDADQLRSATIVVVGPAEVVGPGLDALGLGEVILVDALTDGE